MTRGIGRGAGHRGAGVGAGFGVVAGAFLFGLVAACSSDFGSCVESKTCPHAQDGGGGSGGQAVGGTGGGARAPAEDSGPCSTVDGGIESDPDHCGSCGTVCSTVGTETRACVHGVCSPKCAAPHVDCNKKGEDGCEADLTSDPDHCNACDTVCSASGTAARACVSGICKLTCDATHDDCNKNAGDGCEVDLENDPDHCGSCGAVCSASGTAARKCVSGICKPVCDTTHTDCNANGSDGCEIDLTTNPDNCGTCAYACASTNVAQRLCVAGACSPVCADGYGDCSKTANDGCELSLSTTTDCGACKHDCLGGQCSAQVCQEVTIGSGLQSPMSVTVTDSYVYWVERGTTNNVMRNSIFGGAGATPIAPGQALPYDIENDGLYVYWSNQAVGGALRRVNITGAPIIKDIASKALFPAIVTSPDRLAVDSQFLYWCDGAHILRMPKDGTGSPVALNKVNLPSYSTDVVVDSSLVYFSYSDTSQTWAFVPSDGSTAPQSFPGASASTVLAVDGTSLFYRFKDSVTQKFGFAKIPRGSVTPAQASVVAGVVAPNDGAFTVDSTRLYYWSDALYSIPKAGGTPKRLSGNVDNVVRMVIHAEGGGQAIYWVNQGDSSGSTGSIVKLAL